MSKIQFNREKLKSVLLALDETTLMGELDRLVEVNRGAPTTLCQ